MKAAGAAEYFLGPTNIVFANGLNAQQKYVTASKKPLIIF